MIRKRNAHSISPSTATTSTSRGSPSGSAGTGDTSFLSSSPDDGFGNKNIEWQEDDQRHKQFTFQDCEALKAYGDTARGKGDVREAFLAYSVCIRAHPYESSFWMSRANLALEMKMFFRSLNDSQTSALCLKKSDEASESILSKGSGRMAPSSSSSRSNSKSPSKGLSKLEDLFKKDQKKLLASALYTKGLSSYHLGDFVRASASLSKASKELERSLRSSESEATGVDFSFDNLAESIKTLQNNITSFKNASEEEILKWCQAQNPSVMIKDDSSLPAWFESKDEFEESLEEMAEFWQMELEKRAGDGLGEGMDLNDEDFVEMEMEMYD